MQKIATTAAPQAGAEHRGPLDRVLGVFTEVRGGEGLTALLLMFNVFCSWRLTTCSRPSASRSS